MSRWIKYDIRPTGNIDPHVELMSLFVSISKWIETSKTGRIKIKIANPTFNLVAGYSYKICYLRIKIKNENDSALFLMFFGDYIYNHDIPSSFSILRTVILRTEK